MAQCLTSEKYGHEKKKKEQSHSSIHFTATLEERTPTSIQSKILQWNFEQVEIDNPENNNKMFKFPKLIKKAVFGSNSSIQSDWEYKSGRRRSSRSIYCRYPLDTNLEQDL